MWLDFQKTRGKAVSKDTWSLLVDFIRSIDKEFREYDDAGELDTSNWYSATR
jgi:DCN1-like protein 1/2